MDHNNLIYDNFTTEIVLLRGLLLEEYGQIIKYIKGNYNYTLELPHLLVTPCFRPCLYESIATAAAWCPHWYLCTVSCFPWSSDVTNVVIQVVPFPCNPRHLLTLASRNLAPVTHKIPPPPFITSCAAIACTPAQFCIDASILTAPIYETGARA